MSYGLREKHLTRLGNSFALIIDRPMLHSLGIGPKSRLRVHSDGHRLIVETVKPDHDPKRAARAAFAIRRDALMQSASHLAPIVSNETMEQFGAGRVHFGGFVARIQYQTTSTAIDDLVMDRLEHMRSAYDGSSATIEEAVALALQAVPS